MRATVLDKPFEGRCCELNEVLLIVGENRDHGKPKERHPACSWPDKVETNFLKRTLSIVGLSTECFETIPIQPLLIQAGLSAPLVQEPQWALWFGPLYVTASHMYISDNLPERTITAVMAIPLLTNLP
jgi:hypothetical protein